MKIFKKVVKKISSLFKRRNTQLEIRVASLEKRIELASAIISEQSKLISSLAIVQNDIAMHVRDIDLVNQSLDEKSYLEFFSADDDEFIN